MGEVEGVSGHPGGSGGYSRGHRSTPSQESNTLSQVLRIQIHEYEYKCTSKYKTKTNTKSGDEQYAEPSDQLIHTYKSRRQKQNAKQLINSKSK